MLPPSCHHPRHGAGGGTVPSNQMHPVSHMGCGPSTDDCQWLLMHANFNQPTTVQAFVPWSRNPTHERPSFSVWKNYSKSIAEIARSKSSSASGSLLMENKKKIRVNVRWQNSGTVVSV